MRTKFGIVAAVVLLIVVGGWIAAQQVVDADQIVSPSGATAETWECLSMDEDGTGGSTAWFIDKDCDDVYDAGTDRYLDTQIDWTDLTNYPSACTGKTFITAVGDTLTCDDAFLTGCVANDVLFYTSTNEARCDTAGTLFTYDPSTGYLDVGNLDLDDTLIIGGLLSCDANNEKIETSVDGTVSCGVNTGVSAGANHEIQAGDGSGGFVASDQFLIDDTADIMYIYDTGILKIAHEVGPSGTRKYLNVRYNTSRTPKQWEMITDATAPYPGPALGARNETYLTMDWNAGTSGAAVFHKEFNATVGGAFSGTAGENYIFSGAPLRLGASAMTSGDATPDVSAFTAISTVGGTTITDFDGAAAGQLLIVYADSTITIQDGGDLVLAGGADFNMNAGDTMVLWNRVATSWYEISRSDNTP